MTDGAGNLQIAGLTGDGAGKGFGLRTGQRGHHLKPLMPHGQRDATRIGAGGKAGAWRPAFGGLVEGFAGVQDDAIGQAQGFVRRQLCIGVLSAQF